MKQKQNTKDNLKEAFEKATGEIPFTFLNDYMFRAVLQENEKALKSLICACLHYKTEEIGDVTITNPIKLGEAIDDKTFILDIAVALINGTMINLEMQVEDLGDWPERSLSYLARNYDNLCKGCDYIDVKPVYHIGFLNYTLFPGKEEFFAKYQMMNTKNHHVYTSKFNLYVIDLTQIEQATAEDEEKELVYWTKLFKAKTWEDLKMIAKEHPDLLDAAENLYDKNQDRVIQEQCRARLDYYNHEKAVKRKMAALESDKAKLESDNAALESENAEQKEQIQELEELVKTLREQLDQKNQ